MRVIFPLAIAAAVLFGSACGSPEPEGRTEADAKKLETPAPSPEQKDEPAKTDEGAAKPTEGLPVDETTGKTPLTPPPAGGGKTTDEQPKVGG